LDDIQFAKPDVVIDLSFYTKMTNKEIRSTVSQLHHLYGAIRSSNRPLKVTFTSLNSDLKELLLKVGFAQWKVYSSESSYLDLYDKEKLVYLSPESPHVLNQIDTEKIYIIGGIVDHNRLKGLSYETAKSLGIQSARLPITEILKSKLPNSLNPNHVLEILMDVSSDGNWEQALKKHIPTRFFNPNTPKKKINNPTEGCNDTTPLSTGENSVEDTPKDKEEIHPQSIQTGGNTSPI